MWNVALIWWNKIEIDWKKYVSELFELLNNENSDFNIIDKEIKFFVIKNIPSSYLRNELGDINYEIFMNKITILHSLIFRKNDFEIDVTPKIIENKNIIKWFLEDII